MNFRIAIAGLLLAAPALAAPGDYPAQVQNTGRTAVIGLPYRTSDNLFWVSATKVIDALPFSFKSLEIKPHAGPAGTNLAVFTYVADKAGSTTLVFGLVPPGKMLIGPPSMVYRGPVARKLFIKVVAH